ncbi:hypothetical protein [Bradyrhizobium valentinum]|nr:hypothetical protein [Bradyrhizobium valentinum]
MKFSPTFFDRHARQREMENRVPAAIRQQSGQIEASSGTASAVAD